MGDSFNENLKGAREKKGYTQKDVAARIGVAKSTYSLYESGNREPSVPIIKKIAAALEVSADELLGLDDENTKNEPVSIATHFGTDDYTKDELDEIQKYAEFLKTRRQTKDDLTPGLSEQNRAPSDIDVDSEVEDYRRSLELQKKAKEGSSA
jgi:transcriptional regulator with XRE-family HTH domain